MTEDDLLRVFDSAGPETRVTPDVLGWVETAWRLSAEAERERIARWLESQGRLFEAHAIQHFWLDHDDEICSAETAETPSTRAKISE